MTNSHTNSSDATERVASSEQGDADRRLNRIHRRWILAGIAVVAVIAAVLAALAVRRDDGNGLWQAADVEGQGNTEPALASDGARLLRRDDGLSAVVEVPTPQPGSYDYPTNDMIPPTVESHPPVSPGAADAPEVFTLWLFAFNDGSLCTDGQCDTDDLAPDAAARGGVYQLDGRIADGDTLRLEGSIRLGQQPPNGSPLDNPHGAEVHLAIAPHGRALSGTDGWTQLNTPIGNPTLWWGARFPAS